MQQSAIAIALRKIVLLIEALSDDRYNESNNATLSHNATPF